MQLGTRELHECIVEQIEALARVAAAAGSRLRHVKPHGALYNMAARDAALAETVVDALRAVDPTLILFGLCGSVMMTVAERLGVRAVGEAFADRAYRPDGSLQPRTEPGSVIESGAVVVGRAVEMAGNGSVVAIDGSRITLRAETICLHGDTPGAAVLARRIRYAFAEAGIKVAAPGARP